jgi:hypothetical protein
MLGNYFERMCDLTEEITKICERAQALGDLSEEQDCLRSRIVFNMGRAGEAALNAIGELDGEPKLKIFMFNPADIIKRSEYLIHAAEEYIAEVQFCISK